MGKYPLDLEWHESGSSDDGQGLRGLSSLWGAVRRAFWGTGGLPWVGFVFALLGTLLFFSILMSAGGWQWWMDVKALPASEHSGVVFYSYQGHSYSVDDPNSTRTGPRTVYIIASDPSDGELHARVNQIFDWTITAGPYLVATVFVAAGFARKNRNRRRLVRAQEDPTQVSYGTGLDDETTQRLLAQQRADGRLRRGSSAPTSPVTSRTDDDERWRWRDP